MSKNTNLSFLTDYITADITNGRIGINNASPTVAFDVTGATKITGVLTLTSTISNGTYAYTLPSATGTLALTSALSSYLPLTGGTLTGALNGTSATFSATVRLTNFLRLTKGSSSIVYDSSSNVPRFETAIINTESGSNTGSDFAIYSYNDAGSFLASPLIITRSTGAATFSSSVSANTTVSVTSADTLGTNVNIINTSTGGYNWNIFSGGSSGTLAPVGSLIFRDSTNGNTRMVISPAGNVGIGTSSPTEPLDVNAIARFRDKIYLADGTSSAPSLRFFNSNSGLFLPSGIDAVGFSVGNAERMRILGGNILMGTTSDNGERLYVSGNIRATGTITANSDLTLKKNLLKIENALEKVEQINGYTYELKEDDSKRHAGLIAQEVEIVLPEIVNAGADKIKGIEYGNISALLVEAIKELSTEINIIKKQINN